MTENERLTLKSVNGDVWLLDSEGKPYLLSVDGDDYNNALNRLADFEAIGTVEDVAFYKKCYDEESYEYCGEYGTDNCGCKSRMEHLEKKVAEIDAIGTIEEFKALKEKSVAKKPDYEGDGYYNGQIVLDIWICPNCEKHYEVDYDDYDYCPNCGQHIDHSGLTEDD